jgi:hypothetical protein
MVSPNQPFSEKMKEGDSILVILFVTSFTTARATYTKASLSVGSHSCTRPLSLYHYSHLIFPASLLLFLLVDHILQCDIIVEERVSTVHTWRDQTSIFLCYFLIIVD